MCSGSWNSKNMLYSSLVVFRQHKQKHQQQQQRKQSAHASMAHRRKRLRLRRRREIIRSDGVEMEMVNLKLYLENRCILEENERLREKASALRQENLALRADLRKTSPAPAILMPAAAATSC